MGKGAFFIFFMFISMQAFSQDLPEEIISSLDSVVIDSLEIADAEEEMMYKEDTADYVF